MTAKFSDVLSGQSRWACGCGDALKLLRPLPPECVHACATSPPYYNMRDYGRDGQIGLEATPAEYVARLVEVFREVRRVLHPSGVLWLNLGDSFGGVAAGGVKPKDLLGIPWSVAFALREDGWYLRQHCPWIKRNPLPESVTDRPGTATEEVFLLAKRPDYFWDAEAVKRASPDSTAGDDTGRNFRNSDLWFDSVGLLLADDGTPLGFDVPPRSYKGAHFAVWPAKLVEPMIRAGTSEKGVCPSCGGPWRRRVERERKATRPAKDTKVTGDAAVDGHRDPGRHVTATRTLGWEAGCRCKPHEPVPAVVLDPFAGSGTTLAVAVDLGRRALGCELNPDYLELVRQRMAAVTPSLFGG